MINANLTGIPVYNIQHPLTLEYYKKGCEYEWVRIHKLADKYNNISLNLFYNQFNEFEDQLHARQIYIKSASGNFIGTSTAWNDSEGRFRDYGKIHWIAVIPEYQNKGLGKILLSETIKILKNLGYDKIYLNTDSRRPAAVHLYESFGFRAV